MPVYAYQFQKGSKKDQFSLLPAWQEKLVLYSGELVSPDMALPITFAAQLRHYSFNSCRFK
jgi:hypothetical protein